MSKRIWQHPEASADDSTVSWRGVGQLEDTPAFRSWLDREFPQGVAEMSGEAEAETSRRSFMKLMGASTALAGFGLASCRRPESYIVPYANAPEWVIPGKATYYATSMPRAAGATPLVVTTFEGRPTKLAANTLHPDASGTDVFAQASILDLYSPSRSRTLLKQGKPGPADEFAEILAALAADGSAKIGFVFGRDDSPTRSRLVKELAAKYSAARFYAYEALEGGAGTGGNGVRQVADFAQADRILSLDCDFASLDPKGPTIPFFQRRKPEGGDYTTRPDAGSMNRLYTVESAFSMTGGMADHRLRVAPSQLLGVAAHIARSLGLDGLVSQIEPLSDAKQISWLDAMVEDLQQAGGRALVLAGSRLPAAVQALALAINERLGSIGEGRPLRIVRGDSQDFGDLATLTTDLNGGAIDTLFLLTPSNPVYDAPADLDFPAALAKAITVIHHGTRTDATALASTWHLPASHYLESWSDARTANGVYTVVQPMILPLYDVCASELEILSALLSDDGVLVAGEGQEGAASPAHDAVRQTFGAIGGEGAAAWRKLLRDGFHAGSSYETVAAEVASAPVDPAPAAGGYDVVFATDASVYDGRWIDNGWLQEAPDPISKLSWDNAALIAPQTAKDMGIYDEIVALETWNGAKGPDGEGEHRTGPMIKVAVGGKELEIPVLISFGQAENTIVIPLGYGQGFDKEDKFERGAKNLPTVGLVGVNSGFNAYPLRTTATGYFASGAAVTKTGRKYPLALVQEHHAMYGRALAREVSTIDSGDKKGDFDEQLHNVKRQGNDGHAPPNISLYKPLGPTGKPHLSDVLHQWAMTIDLSSCMGCNACMVACQAENNIPIVGKQQLAMGREMHWIRMDRYYAEQKPKEGEELFDPGNPALVPQPVACVQCESAPCETVCPVNATIHTEDGLNAMAYNRCIGTRYCANNCPYKARRFNFFDYNKRNPLIPHNLYKGPFGEKQVGGAKHLQNNPNVTVRMRGVMEKCTYCVQRLKDSVIRQKRGLKQETLLSGQQSPETDVTTATLRIPVDSVKVACQEACPADAITFGNLLDGDRSKMVRSKESERNYDLLNYIGTRPRTSYLARVKNPNPAMPDHKWIGKATIHMH